MRLPRTGSGRVIARHVGVKGGIERINCYLFESSSFGDARFVMQNDIQQRAVDFKVAVVINQAHFSELIHEKAHSSTRRANHLRERFLADLWNNPLGLTFLAKLRENEKYPSQAPLARIEQLIDQVCLHTDVTRQKMRHKPLRKLWLVMEKVDHRRFLQPHDLGFLNCFGRRNAKGLPSQACLTTKLACSKYSNNRFFPSLGTHCQLNLALLDVENSIRRLALRKDNLSSSVGSYRPSPVCLGEQGFGAEEGRGVAFHAAPPWASFEA